MSGNHSPTFDFVNSFFAVSIFRDSTTSSVGEWLEVPRPAIHINMDTLFRLAGFVCLLHYGTPKGVYRQPDAQYST